MVSPLYIEVFGSIGVGKSVFGGALENHINFRTYTGGLDIKSQLDDKNNPRAKFYRERAPVSLLKEFYEGSLRNGVKPSSTLLASQLFFLANSFYDATTIKRDNIIGIQERTPRSHAKFALVQRNMGFLSELDYSEYTRAYNYFTRILPKPDLSIYLTSDMNTILKRIEHREGSGHVLLSNRKYLEALSEEDSELFRSLDREKLEIELKDEDIIERPWAKAPPTISQQILNGLDDILSKFVEGYNTKRKVI